MNSENTFPHFSVWVENVNSANAGKKEKTIRQYIETHPNLEIQTEDEYFRLLESLDHERYWE